MVGLFFSITKRKVAMDLSKILYRQVAPKVIHSIPGRVRISVPVLKKIPAHLQPQSWEHSLIKVAGITSASCNYTSGNLLIHFDPETTSQQKILFWLNNVSKKLFANRHKMQNLTSEQVSQLLLRIQEFVVEHGLERELCDDIWS